MMNKMDWTRLIEEHRRRLEAEVHTDDAGNNIKNINGSNSRHNRLSEPQQASASLDTVAAVSLQQPSVAAAAISSLNPFERLHHLGQAASALSASRVGTTGSSSPLFDARDLAAALSGGTSSAAALSGGASPSAPAPSTVAEFAALQQRLMLQEQARRELISQALLNNHLQQQQQQQQQQQGTHHRTASLPAPNHHQPLISEILQRLGLEMSLPTNATFNSSNANWHAPDTASDHSDCSHDESAAAAAGRGAKPHPGNKLHPKHRLKQKFRQDSPKQQEPPLKVPKSDDSSGSGISHDERFNEAATTLKRQRSSTSQMSNIGIPASQLLERIAADFPLPRASSPLSAERQSKVPAAASTIREPQFATFRNQWDRLQQQQCNIPDGDGARKEAFVKEFFARKLTLKTVCDNPSLQQRAGNFVAARTAIEQAKSTTTIPTKRKSSSAPTPAQQQQAKGIMIKVKKPKKQKTTTYDV